MIHLSDFSSSQPIADRQALIDGGIRGVHIKCGEGLNESARDSFVAHANSLYRPGQDDLRIGAYHVIAPSSGNPEKQAQNLLKWSAIGAPMMPYLIDVERNRPLGADAKGWVEFVHAYQKELERASVDYLLYTYESFRQELLRAGLATRRYHMAAYPRLSYPSAQAEELRSAVLAAHNRAMSAVDGTARRLALAEKYAKGLELSRLKQTPIPYGKPPANCAVWQFGGDANASTVAGVNGLCDRSYFLGTDEEWDRFWSQ